VSRLFIEAAGTIPHWQRRMPCALLPSVNIYRYLAMQTPTSPVDVYADVCGW